MWCGGQDELEFGPGFAKEFHCAEDGREIESDFLVAAARKERDHRAIAIETQNSRHGRAIRGRRHVIDEGMSHEGDRDLRVAIDLFLKWKDHQHLGNVPLHVLDPASPPGPQLRRDVVDDGNTEFPELAR